MSFMSIAKPLVVKTQVKSPLQNYSWLKHNSVLKKWLSARSALQESPKTSPKHYQNDVFGLRTGGTREREGVFQHADT